MLPKVIVTYKRYPFVYSVGNVRITLDSDITASSDVRCFKSGNYQFNPNYNSGGVLEVKWDEYLPEYVSKLLEMNELYWTSFSKLVISAIAGIIVILKSTRIIYARLFLCGGIQRIVSDIS